MIARDNDKERLEIEARVKLIAYECETAIRQMTPQELKDIELKNPTMFNKHKRVMAEYHWMLLN